MRNLSPTKKKILLLLLSGLGLYFSAYAPQRQWRILKSVSKEWKKINEKELKEDLRQLYETKLIQRIENSDGSITITLTEKGKKRALTYDFEKIKIEKKNWDGKWRMVIYDIPECKKIGRDALRAKIKKIGFYEFQRSVWICPYSCKDQIDFIIEFFDLREHVRFAVVDSIDNELQLKKMFRLM